MSDQRSEQQQAAERAAHNAVADALSNLNKAQTANNHRRDTIQDAHEQLDAAQAQLAKARLGETGSASEDTLS
ncbi:hypothetical protein [Paenibacillus aestuarii]|uniref:Uncharacterized protein n=1 Tax=Paenibacillus aestuarii TaxID=516965 RepID=A0ABW0K8F1_9BACL|nr:hypothetical protein [Paenibacillus aestuarii]